jgi:uncharacterized C2H2 Zn-finger protein
MIDINESGEPVMCSKCNLVFDSDSAYIQHYNEKHKPEEESANNKFE